MGAMDAPRQDYAMQEVAEFEFDARNLQHLARHGIDPNLVYEILAGDPLFFVNPPAENRSGSHLMIGPAAGGRWWTIVMVQVDDIASIWRPITGWPSTVKEQHLWHDE
jgi:hypothetical protein